MFDETTLDRPLVITARKDVFSLVVDIAHRGSPF
jgi:hypothetical protein